MDFERATLPEDAVPEGICPACAAGALFHHPTQTAIAYCSHSLTGATMTIGRDWRVVRGIELHVFRELVAEAVVKGELIGELLLESRRAGPPN